MLKKILLIILIVFLISLAYFCFYKIKSTSDQQTIEWNLHKNNKYNFEIKYPNDWWIWQSIDALSITSYDASYYESQEVMMRNERPDNPIKINIRAIEISPPYKSAREEIEALAEQYSSQMAKVNFNNYESWRRDDEGGGRTYFLPAEDYYVEILFNKEIADRNDIINQILSTFRFTSN